MTRLLAAALAAALTLTATPPALAADIAVKDPYARAAPEGARSSAAYMVIENGGDADDRLVAARSPVAQRVELHTHLMENGVAKMREVEGGISVPAGQTVTLAPGGLHVMMMGLTAPLAEGGTAPLTLVFEQAGEMTLDAPVRAVQPSAGGGHGGMDMPSDGGHGSMPMNSGG